MSWNCHTKFHYTNMLNIIFLSCTIQTSWRNSSKRWTPHIVKRVYIYIYIYIYIVLLFWFIDTLTTNIRLWGHTHSHISPPTQAINGPFQDPAQCLYKSTRCRFQDPAARSRPITDQFIPSNQGTNYSDQSHTNPADHITMGCADLKKQSLLTRQRTGMVCVWHSESWQFS